MGRKLQVQHTARHPADHDLVLIRILQGGGEQPGLDIAPVDEECFVIAVAPGDCRFCDKAVQLHILPHTVDRQHAPGKLAAPDAIDGAVQLPVAGGAQQLLPVADKADGERGMRQRLLLPAAKINAPSAASLFINFIRAGVL